MAYNKTSVFKAKSYSPGKVSGLKETHTVRFGRVIDVILDPFHPRYEDFGKSQSINGVFFSIVSEGTPDDDKQNIEFAYQGSSNTKVVPLKGEIVKIESLLSEGRGNGVNNQRKTYWTGIVPLWNHPHHNAYPDVLKYDSDENDFGDNFEEKDNINPLQLFPGDVTIESRYGSSIRLGGTKYDSNTWIDDSNNGEPITIIRNGQEETDNGEDSVLENINEDKSSIYLTSDHTVELEQANEKRDAWKEEPEKADTFKGSQVLINSGRIYFNAYDEHALISAKEGVGLNAKTISLDGEEYIGLDATKIYLGVAALKREQEPVLKGQTSVDWLDDYLGQFEQLVKGMATAPPAPPAFVAKMIAISNAVLPLIPVLKNRLPNLKSKKVFTE